jgi:hypothetical protein
MRNQGQRNRTSEEISLNNGIMTSMSIGRVFKDFVGLALI